MKLKAVAGFAPSQCSVGMYRVRRHRQHGKPGKIVNTLACVAERPNDLCKTGLEQGGPFDLVPFTHARARAGVMCSIVMAWRDSSSW